MRINDNLMVPVIVQAGQLPWTPSPAAGVDRRMLFRIGDEVARATSIVRYAPNSAFPRHTHGGGEEIVVLDGVFQDEHGDYPAGSYFRNPPRTSHVPASQDGCTIFVRLWQFRDGDRHQIVRRPAQGRQLAPRSGAASAVELFDDGFENVRFESWMPGSPVHGRKRTRARNARSRRKPNDWRPDAVPASLGPLAGRAAPARRLRCGWRQRLAEGCSPASSRRLPAAVNAVRRAAIRKR